MIEDAIALRAERPWPPLAALKLQDTGPLLRRHWPVLAITSMLGALGLYALAAVIPPTYVATAEIFVDPRTVQPLANAAAETDSNAQIIFVESQAHIIGSQSVLDRVVRSEKLDEDPEFAGSSGRTALAALSDHLTVRRPERTFVLDVAVKARTAEKSARLANAITQAYFDEQSAAHAAAARRANQSLTDRLDELRNRVRQAEEKADAFRRSHGLVGTRTQLVSEQQLTDATTQLAQVRSRVVAAQARLDDIRRLGTTAAPPGSAPEAIVSPTVTLLRGQQAEARRRLDKALVQLGPLHPAVQDARSDVEGADRAVANELARIAESAKVDFDRASAAEAAQRAIVADLSDRSANASSSITELGEFEREVEVNKNLLNTFLSRARETSELEQLNTGDARLISTAFPPTARSFPPRGALFAAVGLLLGGALGLLLAMSREARRATDTRPPVADAAPPVSADRTMTAPRPSEPTENPVEPMPVRAERTAERTAETPTAAAATADPVGPAPAPAEGTQAPAAAPAEPPVRPVPAPAPVAVPRRIRRLADYRVLSGRR